MYVLASRAYAWLAVNVRLMLPAPAMIAAVVVMIALANISSIDSDYNSTRVGVITASFSLFNVLYLSI